MLQYNLVKTTEEFAAAAILFKEYAQWLQVDLCFQNFEEELLQLPKMYNLPTGGIILCKKDETYIGCVGIRKIDETNCELKRMFVQLPYHKLGIGSILLQKAIDLAKDCGYKTIKLDTLNHMTPAINLYKKNGFYEVTPYYHNPNETAVYMQKQLV
jgi:putative acetyltransferase